MKIQDDVTVVLRHGRGLDREVTSDPLEPKEIHNKESSVSDGIMTA